MVNGYKRIYMVKVFSPYGGNDVKEFETLKSANKFVLSNMLFDMSVNGKIEYLYTITERDIKEK